MAYEPSLHDIHTDTQLLIQKMGQVDEKVDANSAVLKDHELRLQSLGKWRAALSGAWAVVTGTIIWLVSHIPGTGGGT
jgi:hypothetical protein